MSDRSDRRTHPNLDDLLSDPITWAMMKSDNVAENDLRDLLERVAADLRAGGNGISESDSEVDRDDGMYRRGVGIMLLSGCNQVFVGQRADASNEAWQMPQGGIDDNETPRDAALRELREEVGTAKAHIIAESRQWLCYELPADLRQRWGERSNWCGQRQKWFVMRFEGADADINVRTEHPEFSAWKWVSLEELPNIIVSFKKQLYADLVQEFGHLQ
jgi:putative (di)nucleoside polyphosphate hydrolase